MALISEMEGTCVSCKLFMDYKSMQFGDVDEVKGVLFSVCKRFASSPKRKTKHIVHKRLRYRFNLKHIVRSSLRIFYTREKVFKQTY